MAAAEECAGGGPQSEVEELSSTVWLSPIQPLVNLIGLLLVGEAQGLPFFLGQEGQSDTTSYSKTAGFIRDMLATYPLLTVVGVVIALLSLVPGGLVILCRPRIAIVDFEDPEQAGNDRVRLAMLRGLMSFLLLVLACLLMIGFASNSTYSSNIRRLPEHVEHFRTILNAYEDDVTRTADCVIQSQKKFVEENLGPAYAGCQESLVKDVGTYNLQGRANLAAITEFLNALPAASESADELEVCVLQLRLMNDRLEPLLSAGVPEKPTQVACDTARQPLCAQVLSSWEKLRGVVPAVVLEPPDVLATIKVLRTVIEEERIGSMNEVITQYSSMASDPNKYMTNDIKGDWQRLLAAEVRPQGYVQEHRISLVLKRFTSLISWVARWADASKTPTLHLASNLSQLNTLHMAALTCSWGLSLVALVLGFIGERRTNRLLGRLAEGVFSCFVLQVHVVVSLLLFLGLVGKRAICEPALEPWTDETRAAIGDYVGENPKSKWMDDLPDVILRCHARHTVYQAFKTDSKMGPDKSVAAPPELAHALFALDAAVPMNTSVLFQGLRTNLLDEDNLNLLKTITGLMLAPLGTSDMQQVKVAAESLVFWLQNTSSALQAAAVAMSPPTQESDQVLIGELDSRKKALEEALGVVRGAGPLLDAYLAAQQKFKQNGVIEKQEEAKKQLTTLYEARQLLAASDSATCLDLKSISLTQNITSSVGNGVRSQIGKCAYLSKAYNYSLLVVCDEIVYAMNAFWAATFVYCLVFLVYMVLSAYATMAQRRLDALAEEEEEEEVVLPTTTAGDVTLR